MNRTRSRKRKDSSALTKTLKSGRNRHIVTQQTFEILTPKEIYQNFREISQSHHFSNAIALTCNKPINEMYVRKSPRANASKNLAWCIALIEHHSNKIRFFLKKKKELSEIILSDRIDDAIQLVSEIDKFCGLSMWSIITQSSLNTLREQPEQTNLYEKFGQLDNNGFLKYVLFYVNGYFNDDEIFFTSKNTHKNDIKRSAHPSMKDFYLYRFFDLDMNDGVNFDVVLDVEKNASIIDVFQLIISTLEYFVVTGNSFSDVYDYEIKHVLKTLELVGYEPSCNLNGFFGIKIEPKFDDLSIIMVDLYTNGDYQGVVDLFNQSKMEYSDFCLIELISKSYSRSNTELGSGLIPKIVKNMSNVLERNVDYEKSLEYLSCIANSLRTIDWFKQLRHFVERESPNISSRKRYDFEKGIHLFSCVNTPKKHLLYKDNIKDKYLQHLKDNYEQSSSLNLILNQEYDCFSIEDKGSFLGVNTDRFKKFQAIKMMNNRNYIDAEKALSSLISENDRLLKIEVIRELTRLYILSKSYLKALSIFVEFSLFNDKLFSIFDTREILSAIESSVQDIDTIDLPIAYALHSQYVDESYDSSLKFSFENFLRLNNLIFPTELFNREDVFSKDKLHYFLRWVCTTEVMKLYLNFDTARQIEECRLEICNYLLDKVSDNNDLQFEIKQINKNLIVRKAVKQVENSRIYVDTAVFKGRKSTPYRSLFDRYIELISNQQTIADDAQYHEVYQVLAPNKNKPKEYWKSLSLIYITDTKLSPKNATFLSLAKLIRAEFTFGEKGINNYLSTRIRHGVLPTAIRKSSLTEGIYTPEQSKIEDYIESLVKQANLTVSESDVEQLWKISKAFTKNLENEISLFNDKKLQIYTLEGGAENKNKDGAMFNYSISPLETYAIQQELPLSPTYDDFLKVIMDWLWFRTDYILDEVKYYIREKFTANLNSIFEAYTKEIQTSDISRSAKASFTNAIRRAKNNLQNDLALVCSWFEHVDAEGDGQFELSTAIEIAKRSLSIPLLLSENFEIQIQQKDVSYWVDVFFILFENAISKSNLEKNDVSIGVEIEKENDLIKITVSNKTKPIDNQETANFNLDFYRNAYGDEELTRDAIQGEGGTGFFKIWKIMMRDLNIKHEISFGYKDNNMFSVSLTLYNMGKV
ncbi:hypothetical protein [Aeromonas veronii]|uniref:hypothetical protein n=1 Tax=Aeromonas veronii TaxID=654 RepID=UPI00227D1ADE|nr:hypothetical protein [Aeromonas veronii]